MDNQLVIPEAEPFFFPGNHIGCLLIHGFTGTPKEMKGLGEYFAAHGYTTLGIRLAGHATKPPDIIRTLWEDWLVSVEDGIHLLSNMTDQIFLCGLSMGGILSLVSAARYPVNGIVAMSTPYALPENWLLNLLPIFGLLNLEVRKGDPDWRDLTNLTEHVSYPKYPARSIIQLQQLITEMQSCLPNITCPALFMHSVDDKTAAPNSMEKIYNQIGSQDKSMLWIQDSGHVITREPSRDLVYHEAQYFIERVTQSK